MHINWTYKTCDNNHIYEGVYISHSKITNRQNFYDMVESPYDNNLRS